MLDRCELIKENLNFEQPIPEKVKTFIYVFLATKGLPHSHKRLQEI